MFKFKLIKLTKNDFKACRDIHQEKSKYFYIFSNGKGVYKTVAINYLIVESGKADIIQLVQIFLRRLVQCSLKNHIIQSITYTTECVGFNRHINFICFDRNDDCFFFHIKC